MLDLLIYLFPCLPRRGASQCLQLLPQLPPKAAQLAQRQVLQPGGGAGGWEDQPQGQVTKGHADHGRCMCQLAGRAQRQLGCACCARQAPA